MKYARNTLIEQEDMPLYSRTILAKTGLAQEETDEMILA